MAVETYTKTGSKSKSAATLPKSVFSDDVSSHELLHFVYKSQMSNKRSNSAKTLVRSEVRGGGKKPWRQKGLGKARAGSIRSPIWRGGGITFGPTGNENYTKKINKKQNKKALRQALTLAAKGKTVKIIESFESKDGKTKPAAELLKKLGADRSVLLVLDENDKAARQATRNIPYVKTIQANSLNVVDVLNAHNVIISKKSLNLLEKWLGGKDE